MSKSTTLSSATHLQLVALLSQIASDTNPALPGYKDRAACQALAKNALQLLMPEPPAAAPVMTDLLGDEIPLDPAKGLFVVYTDGGCKGNPGPAGWGVVVVQNGVVCRRAGDYIGNGTNNIAEITAAIEGLRMVPEGSTVELVSDSQYTLKGLTEWRAGWVKRGWKTSGGDPVANQELFQRLYALADKRKVTTRWVRGHNGDPMNELCDSLASHAIAEQGAVT